MIDGSVQLKSELVALNVAHRFVEKVVDKYPEFQPIYGNIELAVAEAVNNAIIHGNRFDPNKSVRLAYTLTEDSLRFEVEDEGTGFDYLHLPNPILPENLEKLEGRGVYLIKRLANRVTFENNGSLVIMEFDKLDTGLLEKQQDAYSI